MAGKTDNNGGIGMGVRLNGSLFPRFGEVLGVFPQFTFQAVPSFYVFLRPHGGVALFPGAAPPLFFGFVAAGSHSVASGFGSVEVRDETMTSANGFVTSRYEAVTRFDGFVGPSHGYAHKSFGSVTRLHESVESFGESVEPSHESVESFYGADKSSFPAFQGQKPLKTSKNGRFWLVAWCGWPKNDS